MTTEDLTPLKTISAFDAATQEQLAAYWITTAEEFVSTALSGNRDFGSGLAALAQVLSVDEARVHELVAAAREVMPQNVAFSVAAELDVGTGAVFEGMPEPAEAFAPAIELPESVALNSELPPPQNQGKRNTCVAFTLVAMYQHASGNPADLSEQFLYWAIKERDNMPHVRGTRPDIALETLRDVGVCAEEIWPYQAQQLSNEGQGPPPDGAAADARRRRISGFTNIPPKNVRQIQAALAAGQLVLLGLPTWEHWTSAWQARGLGRVRQPLPGEADTGGHAICAVGYRNDATAPGGGYFLIRNSWGTDWGKDNPDGPGYGHVPYSLVGESNLAAFAIEAVANAPSPDRTTDTPLAADDNPAPASPADLQAIYAETKAIQQQLDALVQRLAKLTGQE